MNCPEPNCNAQLQPDGGCWVCPVCGWSACEVNLDRSPCRGCSCQVTGMRCQNSCKWVNEFKVAAQCRVSTRSGIDTSDDGYSFGRIE